MKGDAGVPGAKGDSGERGDAGTARAYARVFAGSTSVALDTARTSGFTAVERPATGIYCLTPVPGISVVNRPAVVSVDWSGTADPEGDGSALYGAEHLWCRPVRGTNRAERRYDRRRTRQRRRVHDHRAVTRLRTSGRGRVEGDSAWFSCRFRSAAKEIGKNHGAVAQRSIGKGGSQVTIDPPRTLPTGLGGKRSSTATPQPGRGRRSYRAEIADRVRRSPYGETGGHGARAGPATPSRALLRQTGDAHRTVLLTA